MERGRDKSSPRLGTLGADNLRFRLFLVGCLLMPLWKGREGRKETGGDNRACACRWRLAYLPTQYQTQTSATNNQA